MGSSGSGAADCGVGSIVWVRRRNGSWWPGKILGPKELSASHLMSPRSGTPVKLLGREDASVDWYNLEKSKRVKAFRCGEFDDCIERAESSQGMPIKKREKYARREDAILHALELEKQLLKRQGLLGVTSERKCGKSYVSLEKETVASLGSSENDNAKFGNLKSHQFSKKVDTALKDEIIGSPLYLQKVKEESQLCREDDISEATPWMKGLLDFGLRSALSKRMLSSSVSPNGSEKDTFDNTSQALFTHCPSMGSTSQGNGVEQMGAVSRAKRSRYVYLPTKSSDSLDYKEVPSRPIERPSSQFRGGSRCPHLASFLEESASGFIDGVHLDSSDTDSPESDSDDSSSETEADMDIEMTVLSESDPYALGRPEPLEEYGNLSSEELEESAHSGDTSHHSMPRWKSKGKRNVRNLPRKPMDILDGKAFDFSKRTPRHNLTFLRNDVYNDDADWSGRDVGGPMVGLGNGDYSWSPRYSSKSRRWEDQTDRGRHWDDQHRQDNFDSVFIRRHRARSFLVEVDLQVQASYQKEPVPFVSLMSKLNGKAIIGHPIQIEKLDEGSTDTLLSTNHDFGNEALFYDGNTGLPPEWRSARTQPALDGSDLYKKGNCSHKTTSSRKNVPRPKKSRQACSQKRRTLSSIGVEHKYSIDNSSKSEMDTTVACIPVKLVFSRLLEKINRPPSKALS